MQQTLHKIYSFGDFTLDLTTSALLHEGQEVKLRPKAFDALRYLVENPNRLVSKDELVTAVWADTFVTDDSLVKCLKDVRRALEDDAQQFIRTVPKRGYIFVAEVSEKQQAAANLLFDEQLEAIRVVVEESRPEEEITVAHAFPALPRADKPHLNISRRTLVAVAGLMVLAAGLVYLWTARKPSQPPPVAIVKSMAVLPFRPLGEQNRNEMLEVGLADSLITKLSKIKQLTVRPTSAVLKYAGGEQDAVTIGRTLQVDAVLESRVQQAGDRLKITSQLVRVEDGKVIGSFQFDDERVDILTLQESISKSIVRELQFNLTSEEQHLLTKRYTDNVEAYELYLRGRVWWSKRTEEGFKKALECFKQAIDKDANYALAYAGLADTYAKLSEDGLLNPKEATLKGREALQKALALDDQLAEAHASLAVMLCFMEQKFAEAEAEYRQAITLNPNLATGHYFYGTYLSLMGRHTEAIAEKRKARELEPSSLLFNWGVGWALANARQYDEAIAEFRQTLEMDRSYTYALAQLAGAYLQKQQYDQAIAALQEVVRLNPTRSYNLAMLGYAYAAAGQREKALKILEEVKSLEARTAVQHFMPLAILYAGIGNKDKAFANLEKAFVNNPGNLMYVKTDYFMDSLREDPRFADLLHRLNLTP